MFMLAGILGLMAIGGVALASDFSDDGDEMPETEGADDFLPPDELPPETATGPVPVPSGHDSDSDPVVSNLIIPGDAQDNVLVGAGGDDQINGYAGNDLIEGGAGNDDLHGEDGEDTLLGGAGADTLHGGYGRDDLLGEDGDDTLFGHGDDDMLSGGAGDDELQGGEGDDLLVGDAGNDALHGGLGNDTLIGGAGHDTLFGGAGDDTLSGLESTGTEPGGTGANAPDFLNGGDGDDTILAGGGDVVSGGEGADTIILGDWISEGDAAELVDFDAAQDRLVVICDLDGADQSTLELVHDPDLPGVTRLYLGGAEIARLNGDAMIRADDILLVDHADGAAFGLHTG